MTEAKVTLLATGALIFDDSDGARSMSDGHAADRRLSVTRQE
jgi:hypothetical protein